MSKRREHDYTSQVKWTGNRGQGTLTYRGYDRTWNIETPGHAVVHCSNDPLLGGDPTKPNPEDLLLSSLAACHMLWYLHLASAAGIVVFSYADQPLGLGETNEEGGGRFLKVTLRPHIEVLAGADLVRAEQIHHEVHRYCFIARSVNFPIEYAPTFMEVERSRQEQPPP
jgi:organic hydroperoxide reductase OsmC/OhrA